MERLQYQCGLKISNSVKGLIIQAVTLSILGPFDQTNSII